MADSENSLPPVDESVEIAATGSRLSIHIIAINSAQNQHTGHLVLPKLIEPIRADLFCDVNRKLGSLQGNRVKAILSNFGINWPLCANQNCSVRAQAETIESKKPFTRFPWDAGGD